MSTGKKIAVGVGVVAGSAVLVVAGMVAGVAGKVPGFVATLASKVFGK